MDRPDFRLLFEAAPALLVVFDRDLRIVAASDGYLRALGRPREAVVGRTLAEMLLLGSDDPAIRGVDTAQATLRRVFDSGRPDAIDLERYDVPRPKEAGGGYAEHFWSAVSVPIGAPNGGVDHVLSHLQDTTGTEQHYRQLLSSVDIGYCVIELVYDRQGAPVDFRFLEVNPAFERHTGLLEPTRKTMREHAPGHEQQWFEIYDRVARTGEAVRFTQEASALTGRWYDVYAYRVGGEGSSKVGILFSDITDRVLAEQALRDSARRKDEFLAVLAHELRNPLAPIRNAVAFMRLKGSPDPQLQHARDLVDRQVSHLVRLVDDLLDVSRIAFGKIQLRRARVDLREVAREALATSEPLLAAGSHRLSLSIGEAPVWVEADRMRLSQVISNLLNNASRYTPSGGEIALDVHGVGDEAVISVQDNGVGIPSDMLGRIFEPFTQVAQPGTTGAGGIGIGLSLAKALVELHGGRISASSGGANTGARFVVALPLAAEPVAAVAGDLLAEMPSRRFLVVDDNVDAATSQADVLRFLGHEVEVAFDGAEALRKFGDFHPQVVLLDLGMPGMDGYEVARRLRATPQGRDAVLIAQTGWGQEEHRRRTHEAGFQAHLAKPVDLQALMRAVHGATP